MKLLDVRKIWDEAPHNAFTDLVHFKGRFFCVFREGEGHVSPDGALRVIVAAREGREIQDRQHGRRAGLLRLGGGACGHYHQPSAAVRHCGES